MFMPTRRTVSDNTKGIIWGVVIAIGLLALIGLGVFIYLTGGDDFKLDLLEDTNQKLVEETEIEQELFQIRLEGETELRDRLTQLHIIMAEQRRKIESMEDKCLDRAIEWPDFEEVE